MQQVLYDQGVRHLPYYAFRYPNQTGALLATADVEITEYYQYTQPTVLGFHYEGL